MRPLITFHFNVSISTAIIPVHVRAYSEVLDIYFLCQVVITCLYIVLDNISLIFYTINPNTFLDILTTMPWQSTSWCHVSLEAPIKYENIDLHHLYIFVVWMTKSFSNLPHLCIIHVSIWKKIVTYHAIVLLSNFFLIWFLLGLHAQTNYWLSQCQTFQSLLSF